MCIRNCFKQIHQNVVSKTNTEPSEEERSFGKFVFPCTPNEKPKQATIDCLLHGELSNGDEGIINLLTVLANTSELFINRRHGTNTFFATAHGGILGAIFLLLSRTVSDHQYDFLALKYICLPVALLCIAGVILCNKWFQFLKAYWIISRAKVEVVKALESRLNIRVFSTQYNLAKANEYPGLTMLESRTPRHLRVAYVTFGIIAFLVWIGVPNGNSPDSLFHEEFEIKNQKDGSGINFSLEVNRFKPPLPQKSGR